jgi:hypothetical protein
MGPLVRVTYSGLIQSVFILDRVNSSSCDCPAKIPVDMNSNASCFMCFISGSSSPEVADFCPTLHLVYVIAWPKPPLAHYPAFIVCLATTLFKKKFHKWKHSWLQHLRTRTCPEFLKTWLLFHMQLTRPRVRSFDMGFLRFTPLLVSTSVAFQHGIYSFPQTLSWERQMKWIIGLGLER